LLDGCRVVEVDLAALGHIDGSGAALLARLLDRVVMTRPPDPVFLRAAAQRAFVG